MATKTLDQLATIASEQSGLPADLTKAMIQLEGTSSYSNNPFDVTSEWAGLTGFESWVTGVFGTQGNIALFSDPVAAIQSWWKGLSTWSSYSQFQADVASGASVYQLGLDLQKAGYAGNSTTYADSLARIYQENTGKSAYAPLGSSIPASVTTNPGVSAQTAAISPTATKTTPLIGVWPLPDINFTNPASAVAAEAAGVNNVANAVTNFGSIFVKILADAERFFWILLGFLIILVGIWILVRKEEAP